MRDGKIATMPVQVNSKLSQHRNDIFLAPGSATSIPLPEEQGLCIGAVFSIRATNGIDLTRRVRANGFCQSVERLSETVEKTVAQRGGEVWNVEYKLNSGVHEGLTISLALPFLWGVPPQYEQLEHGIKCGGGIIDSVIQEWLLVSDVFK
jgi:hypothetical protein